MSIAPPPQEVSRILAFGKQARHFEVTSKFAVLFPDVISTMRVDSVLYWGATNEMISGMDSLPEPCNGTILPVLHVA